MFGPPSSSSRVRIPFARSASSPSWSRSRSSSAASSSEASFSNRASSIRSLLGEPQERLAFEAHGKPFGDYLGTERTVETERRLVPVEHLPLEAPAALPY